MPCSDSMAQMLEERDPAFRARNDYNGKARAALCSQSESLCSWGDALYRGEKPIVHIMTPPGRPYGNGYLDADDGVAKEFGCSSDAESLTELSDASRSIVEYFSGSGKGEKFFRWLASHWERDAKYLAARNERHKRELPAKHGVAAQKRRDFLAKEIPLQAEFEKKHTWALAMLNERAR